MMNRRHLLAVGILVAATAAAFPAHGLAPSARRAAPKLGHWTKLSGGSEVPGSTPAVWLDSKHHLYDVWPRKVNSATYTYEVNRVAANGKPNAAADVFPGAHWGSLSFNPTLLGQGNAPLVVFSGAQGTTGPYSLGCIYGALGPTAPWAQQNWSLSDDCVNPVPAVAEDKSAIAAAWPSGNSVFYRVKVAPTIPPATPDRQISLSSGAVAKRTGLAADNAASGDFYVAWAQANSTPASKDGYYVKDVTSKGPIAKAPGSNTNSVNRLPASANVAIAAASSRPGVYLAYCAGSIGCKLRLWRVGAKSALTVPGTANPYGVSISAAPHGRVWTAWYDNDTNRVYVTRSNQKVSRFGPVRSYSTPCVEDGLLGLSSGSAGRLDIGLECVDNKLAGAEYVAQAEVALKISASSTKAHNTSKHKISMTVTDVGDPVTGATVHFNGHKAKTNSNGKVSFTLAKHAKTGKYRATASKADYRSAHVTVTVTS